MQSGAESTLAYIQEYQGGGQIGSTQARHLTLIPLFAEDTDMR